MLTLVERSVLISFYRRSLLSSIKRSYSDRISDAYRSVRKPSQTSVTASGGHATKTSYDQQMASQRVRGADAETGLIPTNWQKFCLVITGLYKSKSDIPQYVSGGTMNRMHDRMRVVFIAVAVVCFFVLFYNIEAKNAERIARDRDAGVIVKQL
uniref:Transmembrane protein n=1 Tax=Haemonchus contortus TaxID=6289 RepID=A0A7I5E6U9_HAECO